MYSGIGMTIAATVSSTPKAKFPVHVIVQPSIDLTGVLNPKTIDSLTYSIYRMKVVKTEGSFWADFITTGKTNDYNSVHIFHHPSANQHKDAKGHATAPDGAYDAFSGGWHVISEIYANFVGAAHAASKSEAPLLIPYNRTSSFNSSSPSNYMLASDPIETINAIMAAAIEDDTCRIKGKISTSSFSNGIVSQALTMNYMVAFVGFCVDYDSGFITGQTRDIGPAQGRDIYRYSQKKKPAPATKYFHIPSERWPDSIKNKWQPWNEKQLHHQICYKCHTDAMNNCPF